MTSESVAQRLQAAAAADAALAADLGAAYLGRHDVLDALWWRVHPLTDTSAGLPDPAARLPRMQAAVYSRTRPDGSLADSERQLRDLLAQLRQDNADLDEVLLLFSDGVSSPEAAPAGGAVLSPRAIRGPTRLRGSLLALAGVLFGGIAVATAFALVPHGAPTSGAAAEPAASASPGLLALFDQPPIPDQTTIDLGPGFRRDSIHAMFIERETSSVVYVARRGDDLYCVILSTQGQQGASVCVGLAELARRGLNLTVTVPVNPFTLGKDSIESAGALADVTIRVSTDGGVSSETAPHPAS